MKTKIDKLVRKVNRLENMEIAYKAQIVLMDEYRQEMIDLRLSNTELRRANKFLKKATYALRQINRRLRLTICYAA